MKNTTTCKTEEEFIQNVFDGLPSLADSKPDDMDDYDAHLHVVEFAISWAVTTKTFLVQEHMKEDGDPDITRMVAQELGILESIQTLWFEYTSRHDYPLTKRT